MSRFSCALLVVIGFKGYRPPLNLLIGIALPLVVMGVWAYFVAPMSAHRLPAMARIVVEFVLFGTVAVLVGRQWSAKWGWAFAILAAVNCAVAQIGETAG